MAISIKIGQVPHQNNNNKSKKKRKKEEKKITHRNVF